MSGKERMKKILIVDDEESVGIGMSEILKDAGFAAAYVTSGAAALETMKQGGYSLVFMDMVMPGMNGLETYRRLKQVAGDVQVVIFTGYFRDAERSIFEGVKEGMIDIYIRKPFFAEEVVHAARKYL